MDVKDDSNWDLAPDGRQLVLFGVEGPIRLMNFGDRKVRQVIPRHWKSMDYVTWANGSKGLYGSSPTQQGDTLLHLNLLGDVHVLSQNRGSFDTSAIPSPDGQHIAIQDWNLNSNVWMMENF